jgi:two-component system sensor histidine kinase UhpB
LFLGTVSVPLTLLAAVLGEWRNTEDGLRDTQMRLIDIQEQERRRIARELHDDVGQRLALLQIELTELQRVSDSSLQPRVAQLCDQLAQMSEVTSELSHGLHPSYVEYVGLGFALKKLCKELIQGKPCAFDISEEALQSPLSPDISLCLYRVAQEALHNVEKHSMARNVTVELKIANNRVVLRVADDGSGFVPDQVQHTGLGLTSMRERLRSLGGALEISSRIGEGTRIEASVPLGQVR